MSTLLADTSYLTDSPYGLWGVVMVVFLLGLLCYNAWVDDAAERRRGYYVLAAALVLGLLILFALHFWQVDPMELMRTLYKRPGLRYRHSSYNGLLFLSLGYRWTGAPQFAQYSMRVSFFLIQPPRWTVSHSP